MPPDVWMLGIVLVLLIASYLYMVGLRELR